MADMAGIPQKLVDYNIYASNDKLEKLMGRQAETELPSFEALTTTISGGGILGETESPNPGHFGSMQLSISFRTLTEEASKLAEPRAHTLTLRADQDSYDETNGIIRHRPLKVVVRGFPTALEPGKLNPGNMTDTKVTLEISYIKITLDKNTLLELDKFNFIFVVNNKDYMQEVRNNI